MEAGFIPVATSGNAGNNALPPAVVAPQVNVVRAPGLKRGKMEEAISDRIFIFKLLRKILALLAEPFNS
ncbi:hypothetical protein RR48_08524 [Papilio machaon]|uniref:Uncharacterized protein n=1 Tax=Papilio machaon TaxID=76193 RepID=A0A194RHN4_PAPMA|nr:hypothetical protein RR48_08524 [Papilio machaon]